VITGSHLGGGFLCNRSRCFFPVLFASFVPAVIAGIPESPVFVLVEDIPSAFPDIIHQLPEMDIRLIADPERLALPFTAGPVFIKEISHPGRKNRCFVKQFPVESDLIKLRTVFPAEAAENAHPETASDADGYQFRIKQEKVNHSTLTGCTDGRNVQSPLSGTASCVPVQKSSSIQKPPAIQNKPGKESTDPVTKEPPRAYIRSLLDQFRKELSVRNYSRRTIRNYTDIAAKYLDSLQHPPGTNDCEFIKNHLIFLKDELGYSPRTVNLHSAALSFFYQNVVGISDIPGLNTRMKTGHQLPKVYSIMEIEDIVSSISNPVHRLIVLLTYAWDYVSERSAV